MTKPSPSSLADWGILPNDEFNIAARKTIPARVAQIVPLPDDAHPGIIEWLRARGIESLYTHQATAWGHARDGKHMVVVTGTASGKTLCYNLPVLDKLLRDDKARALYLFPTKALAQDQVANLKDERRTTNDERSTSFVFGPSSFVAPYDGDTPQHLRSSVRKHSRIIVSNPDMVHTGILPHHAIWAEFFRNLRFVVIDEMHAYRGVFGSHVANVIRRLKRIAQFYGASPQFILTSATIANPVELAERLVEESVTLVDNDGAAKGEKQFLIYNPPIVDHKLGIRRSSMLEGVRLTQELLKQDIQTIVFARSRRTVEIMRRYLGNADAIRSYRSGYLPSQRREIERGLRDGSVRAVVATNALELGIDIGGMGAAVLVGYPGTIAATMQQAGRAGRGDDASLAMLVASADPLDQFLARHPDYIFGRSPERALINPDNLLILLAHLRCAAFELPFKQNENFGRVPNSQVLEFLQFLSESGVVHESGGKFFWMSDQYPSDAISLRSASAQTVSLQINVDPTSNVQFPTSTIGTVDLESAYWMVHPEAIYLHEGESYVVGELDLEHGIARLVPTDADYYTEPRRETQVQLLDELNRANARGAIKAHGEIAVTTQVTGYKKIKWFTHENLGEGIVSLPPTELHTTGYWLAVTDETVAKLRDEGLWSNAPNDYGPDWDAIRNRVRARDKYRCQGCGAAEDGRPHHVHHKIPFRAFVGTNSVISSEARNLSNPESAMSHSVRHDRLARIARANTLDNLVTLCPNCHRRAELAVRIRSGLAGVSNILGHLAPLFLMCDTGDIGVHSDPESPLADGKPTVVIYDMIPAGIGFSERLFELHDELLARALDLVSSCGCEDGCPSCVGPGGENGYGGKKEAKALLEALKV
jgi:DEAD/DEAH box helicase domain-containing protein